MKKLFLITTLLAIVSCQNKSQHLTPSSFSSKFDSILSKRPLTDESPWIAIQQSSKIRIPYNYRIDAERQKLLVSRHAFQRVAARSEPYMYYIIDQLKKRGMPVELAIIPLMESAYNPQATSPANAAGLWQMVPTTAKAFGMKCNHWYDSRRDLLASTEAALTYLQYLNKLFDGDWLLTLAAYNSGEGRIKRAQSWNKIHRLPTHFWALNLPIETMQYVPKLLAVVDIVKNNRSYNINLPDGDDTNALVQINVGEKVEFTKISQLSDLSLDELKTYNAAYLKNIINGPYHLLIPKHQAKQLYKNLIGNDFLDTEIIDLLSLPKKGSEYQSHNIKITNNKYLVVTDQDLRFFAKEHQRHRQIIYLVKPGDNLSRIGQAYNVSIKNLMQWNKLKNLNTLKAGSKLLINLK